VGGEWGRRRGGGERYREPRTGRSGGPIAPKKDCSNEGKTWGTAEDDAANVIWGFIKNLLAWRVKTRCEREANKKDQACRDYHKEWRKIWKKIRHWDHCVLLTTNPERPKTLGGNGTGKRGHQRKAFLNFSIKRALEGTGKSPGRKKNAAYMSRQPVRTKRNRMRENKKLNVESRESKMLVDWQSKTWREALETPKLRTSRL